MAVCEICVENRSPGQGPRDSFQNCPQCGAEVLCSGYTTISRKGETAHCPVCEECGQSPILACSMCAWHNAAYDDVLLGLKDS